MINFRIVPITYTASTLLREWTPSEWPMIQHDINPWADPFIDRLNLLIYNLKRQTWIRSSEVRNYYWQRFDDDTLVQIEAEFGFYLESTYRYIAILEAYIWDHYLDEGLDSFAEMKIAGDWVNRPNPAPDEFPVFFAEQSIFRDALDSFEPKNARFRADRVTAYKEAGDSLPIHWTPASERANNSLSPNLPWESILHDQFNHLLYEFHLAALNHNEIPGASSKARALLTNGNIPIPNEYTILAWFALCGTRIGKLSHRMWFNDEFDWLIQYSLPSMPMTQEHVLNAPIPGDDTDSSHSLGFKSPAHNRDSYGRILHGKWENVTALLRGVGGHAGFESRYLVSRNVFADGERRQIELVMSADQMLPWIPKASWSPGFVYVTSPVFHPYYASQWPVGMNHNGVWDLGMRSLAKWNRIHLRFDDTEMGTLAAEEWRAAFESTLIHVIQLGQTEILKLQFDAALIRQTIHKLTPKATGAKRGRKPKNDFGFSRIWGDDDSE